MSESRFPDFPRDEYGKRLRGENGRLICRGCKFVEVPPKRESWCSLECKKKFHPHWIKLAVWERDGGICQKCGLDLFEDYVAKHPNHAWAQKIGREKIMHYSNGIHADFDHIIPFSEGGATVAENMRVLCRPCHVIVTAEWRRKKALERKGLQVLEFSS